MAALPGADPGNPRGPPKVDVYALFVVLWNLLDPPLGPLRPGDPELFGKRLPGLPVVPPAGLRTRPPLHRAWGKIFML